MVSALSRAAWMLVLLSIGVNFITQSIVRFWQKAVTQVSRWEGFFARV